MCGKLFKLTVLLETGTLLTIVLLMRAVDPLKYEAETMNYLSKLEVVDKTRQQYYKDMSKLLCEMAIMCIIIFAKYTSRFFVLIKIQK